MATSPVWALPYPAETDPADVPVDVKKLVDRLEAVLTSLKTGGSIPGEVRMWSGSALPDAGTYGHWVWADGTPYATATYPISAANIAVAWKTHAGKVDPGVGQFRVPDMRGQTPVGLDAMPGGARANRITRASAAVLAGVTGEELHTLLTAELAAHGHGVNDPPHGHGVNESPHHHTMHASTGSGTAPATFLGTANAANDVDFNDVNAVTGITVQAAPTGITIVSSGGGGAHENLQPTVFVPYIVKLDD